MRQACKMAAVLRFTIMVLLASRAYGSAHYYPRGRVHSHYRPRYHHPQPQIYSQHQSFSKPACNAETPCYEQLLVYAGDSIPESPSRAAFINHYNRAGFDRYAIIEEGKRAAQYFRRQYGVDVGYLPDEAYIAPNITLQNGMTFTFGTRVPPNDKRTLAVAAQRDSVQFINAPVSAAAWALIFPREFYSNGAVKGKIPAGASSVFGSYYIEVCPDESYNNPCRSTLSRKPKGQIFIRFQARTFHTSGIIDCDLVHDEWGAGLAIGADVTDQVTGVRHQRSINTFPNTCDTSRQCFAKRWG